MTKLSQLPVYTPLASDNLLALRGTSDILVNAGAISGLTNQIPVVNQTLATISAQYPAANYAGFYAYSSDQGLVASNGVRWYAVIPTVNVVAFGADPTGATDSTVSFNAAIAAAQAGVNSQGSIGGTGIVFAPNASVYVPPGTYTLSSELTVNGIDITWILSDDALIANYQYLNGRVVRNGRRFSKATYGIGDFAAGFYVGTNYPLEQGAPVMGFTSAQQRQTLGYSTFDSVGFLTLNNAVAPIQTIANAGTTYTATTISFTSALTAAQLAQMRSGMFIGTQHSPSWYGYVTAWAANTITVSAWYQMTGSGSGTPANGTGAYVNPITKVFGANVISIIPAGSIATASASCEFDTNNNLANPGGPGGTPLCWGVDSVNLGTYPAEAAFIARGSWYYGYEVGSGVNNAASTVYGFSNNATYGTSVTANCVGFISSPTLANSLATVNVRHFQASSAAFGSGASATTQIGFYSAPLSGAGSNYGFQGVVAAGTNNYNLYMSGTAYNYLAGQLGIGSAPSVSNSLTTTSSINTGTQQIGYQAQDTLSGTSSSIGIFVSQSIAASTAVTSYSGAQINNPTLNAGATITTCTGLHIGALTSGGTNNYGMTLGVASSANGAYNIFANGSAPNYFAGDIQIAGGSQVMMHAISAMNGGATGNAPTLTAGPVTGNPTKWLAFNDAGTTRYIPSW